MDAITTAPSEPRCYSLSSDHFIRLSLLIRETLSRTPYAPPEGSAVSAKSLLESLLQPRDSDSENRVRDFVLCCAALAASEGAESPSVHWISAALAAAAREVLREVSTAVGLSSEAELAEDVMPAVMPELKGAIRESCVDTEEEEIAASAKKPVTYAALAAHQCRWLVSQVGYPNLGKLCWLIIPCALTALDHWSPEVKEQGMVTFVYLAKNVTATELSWYEDAILDACFRNIASSDELWHCVVEMAVLFLTCTQRRNPRSVWFEQIMNEMLTHLERQPMNKNRRIEWLVLADPLLIALGLVLLSHFQRLFSLFFLWMHADDDKTVILVLERLCTIIRLTWARRSPLLERLVNELVLLYKESSTKRSREAIRCGIIQVLELLCKCQGVSFAKAWEKHESDPDLSMLPAFSKG